MLSTIKTGVKPHVTDVVDEMVRAWRDDYRDPETIRNAVVKYDSILQEGCESFASALR